jgi:hypothetical protein
MTKEHRRSERIGLEIIDYNNHIERLHKMKPTFDTHTSLKLPKLIKHSNHSRIIEIEKQNINLLERIAVSIQSSHINNKLPKQVTEYSNFQKKIKRDHHVSNLKKIQENNKRLLQRIQEIKPIITRRQLEYDYIKSREKMKLLCLYPEYLPNKNPAFEILNV